MSLFCIAGNARSGTAPKKRVTRDVTSAMNFPAGILKTFRWLLEKRLFYGPFRIGERSALKSGLKMKKPAIFVLNAAIKFSGALLNVINVKRIWIWIRTDLKISSSFLILAHLLITAPHLESKDPDFPSNADSGSRKADPDHHFVNI